MAAFVSAFCAIRCIEILDAGSATGNRLSKHRLHGAMERDNRSSAQPIHLTVRMEPGTKENFVRVNIPNPCDHLLMHQQGLQASTPGLHVTDELIARHREGIDPEAASTITVESLPIEQRQT